MRSDSKKRLWNQMALSELYTLYRKLTNQAKTNLEVANEEARKLVSKLDKAVARGIIPRRRADRKKARIAKYLHKKS